MTTLSGNPSPAADLPSPANLPAELSAEILPLIQMASQAGAIRVYCLDIGKGAHMFYNPVSIISAEDSVPSYEMLSFAPPAGIGTYLLVAIFTDQPNQSPNPARFSQ